MKCIGLGFKWYKLFNPSFTMIIKLMWQFRHLEDALNPLQFTEGKHKVINQTDIVI